MLRSQEDLSYVRRLSGTLRASKHEPECQVQAEPSLQAGGCRCALHLVLERSLASSQHYSIIRKPYTKQLVVEPADNSVAYPSRHD